MPNSARRQKIIQMLSEGKPLSVKNLSDLLGVSAMTIRRDLDLLEDEGRLKRSYGWAEPVRTEQYEPSYVIRLSENSDSKKAICKAAANLVKDGDVIFLDVGTTLLFMPEFLKDKKGVTVLTHWLPQVMELAKYPGIRTVVLGGTLRSTELSLTGMIPESSLGEFNADICFLSIGGVSSEKGITDYNMEEVEIKKAAMACARQRIVTADHTKLGRVAPIKVAPLDDFDLLITNGADNTDQLDAIKGSGLEIILAD